MDSKKRFVKPKKDFSDLLESKYVKKWVSSYKDSEKQKKLGVLDRYIKFTEKDPHTLIIEHNDDMRRDDPISITNVAKKQIAAFYSYLTGEKVNEKVKKKPITLNSARQYAFSIVTSFYSRNNIPVRFERNEIPKEQKGAKDKVWRSNGDRVAKEAKKEVLKKIRDSLPLLRDKAILHCKISSGMDDVDLFNLTIEDWNKGYFSDYNICYIEGNRAKTDIRFQTFFNNEACHFVELYLKERKDKGELMSNKSYLFVSHYLRSDGIGKRVKANAFSKNIREVCSRLEINNITPKALRHYFNTVVIRALHDDKEIVERMMGHIGNISGKYQQLFDDIEEFAKFYFEHIDVIVSLENGGKAVATTKKELLQLRDYIAKQNEKIQMLLEEKVEFQRQINEVNSTNKETSMRIDTLEESIKDLKNLVKDLKRSV